MAKGKPQTSMLATLTIGAISGLAATGIAYWLLSIQTWCVGIPWLE